MSMLAVENLTIRHGHHTVVQDVSFTLHAGEGLALAGPNGAGKTSVLRALMGLAPFSGSIRHQDIPVSRMKAADWPRRAIYVPQRTEVVWSPRTMDILTLGFEPLFAVNDLKHRAASALDRLGIGAPADQAFDTLSGGERQRVFLARALISNAPLIVLDEPLAALDDTAQSLVNTALAEELSTGRAILGAVHRAEDLSCLTRVVKL